MEYINILLEKIKKGHLNLDIESNEIINVKNNNQYIIKLYKEKMLSIFYEKENNFINILNEESIKEYNKDLMYKIMYKIDLITTISALVFTLSGILYDFLYNILNETDFELVFVPFIYLALIPFFYYKINKYKNKKRKIINEKIKIISKYISKDYKKITSLSCINLLCDLEKVNDDFYKEEKKILKNYIVNKQYFFETGKIVDIEKGLHRSFVKSILFLTENIGNVEVKNKYKIENKKESESSNDDKLSYFLMNRENK